MTATAKRDRGAEVIRTSQWTYLRVALSVLIVVVASAMPAAAQNVNPPWPGRCPLRVGLLVDQSESMGPHLDELRGSVKNLVDALRDKHSEVTVVGFGSSARTIAPMADVSVDDGRHRLKDDIDSLTTLSGDNGGTNWEAAFSALSGEHLGLVVIVTDGVPTAYGNPPQGAISAAALTPLNAAVSAADRLKAGGTRVVGVGIGLPGDEATANLARITGPVEGTDYYASQVMDLLHQLYDIAAKACGVPLSALPTPEPPDFPLVPVLLWTAGGLVVLAALAFLLYRRRRAPVAAGPKPSPASTPAAADPTIRHDDILREITSENRPATGGPPGRRSLSLDFLADDNRPARDE